MTRYDGNVRPAQYFAGSAAAAAADGSDEDGAAPAIGGTELASSSWRRDPVMRAPRHLSLSCALCLVCLPGAGCLVPLGLEQQNQVDGGLSLYVDSATPPFGTLAAMKRNEGFTFSLHVRSDSRTLAGRLCVQVNQSCCDLMPDNLAATRCVGDANVVPTGDPDSFTVTFQSFFAPCGLDLTVPRVYVVPVLASQGFDSSTGMLGIRGFGTIDKNHYWSVLCP